MTEAIFPLIGAAFVVLVVLPAFALLAKLALVLLERKQVGGALHGLNLRYVILTASSAMPLAWFFSAGLHQAETGSSALACLLDHGKAALCFEPGFFAMVLAACVTIALLRALQEAGPGGPSLGTTVSPIGDRIERLITANPSLVGLRNRIVLIDDDGIALATRGLVRPRVYVGTAFAASLTDAELASSLGHEHEHVRSFDPLRYFLLELALGVNPFGRLLLAPHLARWKAAREAHCDREAVIHGFAPLPLADAILRAARPATREAVALGTGQASVLKLRINLLLAFAEHAPHRCCNEGRTAIPIALALFGIALLLPHETSTEALDALHTGVESALSSFLH